MQVGARPRGTRSQLRSGGWRESRPAVPDRRELTMPRLVKITTLICAGLAAFAALVAASPQRENA